MCLCPGCVSWLQNAVKALTYSLVSDSYDLLAT